MTEVLHVQPLTTRTNSSCAWQLLGGGSNCDMSAIRLTRDPGDSTMQVSSLSDVYTCAACSHIALRTAHAAMQRSRESVPEALVRGVHEEPRAVATRV